MKSKNTNILICVSGLTPQIITETLFCLSVKNKVRIDEIYLITTTRGRTVLLGKDPEKFTPKVSFLSELKNMCALYKLPLPEFAENDKHIIIAKEESVELYDIRSDADNQLFPNKISEFLRTITERENITLHCSISGGRKTMGVHLAFGLALFGRANDKLYHVLTSEENEFKGFYPKTKKEADALQLAEIPFVPLRPLVAETLKIQNPLQLNFTEIVAECNNKLKMLSTQNALIVDTIRRQFRYANSSERAEPMELALYTTFFNKKREGSNFLEQSYLTGKDFCDEMKFILQTQYGRYYDDTPTHGGRKERKWYNSSFEMELLRQKFSKINKKLKNLIPDEDIASGFFISSERTYGVKSYGISAPLSRIKLISES